MVPVHIGVYLFVAVSAGHDDGFEDKVHVVVPLGEDPKVQHPSANVPRYVRTQV